MTKSRAFSLLAAAVPLLFSCEQSSEPRGARDTPTTAAVRPAAYNPSKDGFVVHEWGTFTSVSGSDGVLLPGLHHEEEDLPKFVYKDDAVEPSPTSRFGPAALAVPSPINGALQKMETPVTYFYSPAARKVAVRIGFTNGLLTQWFPGARNLNPRLDGGDATSASPSPSAQLKNGLLDWTTVNILGRQERPVLPGPLGETNWGFARNTASNVLAGSVAGGDGVENEKFLFYRGLGQFELPLKVRFSGAAPSLVNTDDQSTMRGMFLLTVTPTRAGFKKLGDLKPGTSITSALPEPNLPSEAFVMALKTELAATLVESGLFNDEAKAMVDTWKQAYLLTPGARLLYVLPQVWTDRLVPMQIEPAPDKVVRAMVIRVDIISPELERTMAGWLSKLGGRSSPEDLEAARAGFLGLGRFAEPHLQRALTLATGAAERNAGQDLLKQVRQHTRWAPAFPH